MSLRFLIADDSATNRTLLKMTMTRAGHTADLARNGKEALMFFTENFYDIVLLDINMPVMGGFETAKEIKKKNRRNIPVYAMSGFLDERSDAFLKDAGVRKVYTKPIDKQKIFDILEDAGFDDMEYMQNPETALDLDDEIPAKLYRAYAAELKSRSKSCVDKKKQGNYPGLAREAHTLRSLAAILRTDHIVKIAEDLEKAASLKDKEKIKETVTELSALCIDLADTLLEKIEKR